MKPDCPNCHTGECYHLMADEIHEIADSLGIEVNILDQDSIPEILEIMRLARDNN